VGYPIVWRELEPGGDRFSQVGDLSPAGHSFDLAVVDGPLGRRRRSRWASLDLLETALGSDFVVIFDDAERPGEQDTIKEFAKRFDVGCHHVISSKCQLVLYTKKFDFVRFY